MQYKLRKSILEYRAGLFLKTPKQQNEIFNKVHKLKRTLRNYSVVELPNSQVSYPKLISVEPYGILPNKTSSIGLQTFINYNRTV